VCCTGGAEECVVLEGLRSVFCLELFDCSWMLLWPRRGWSSKIGDNLEQDRLKCC
jgi:hypothetical protein